MVLISNGTKVVMAVLAVAAMAAGWYLLSPLFIDREVNEEFPVVESMADPDMPDTVMDEAMPADAQPVALANGTFTDADAAHQGEGTAALYQLPDGRYLIRFEDFRVTNGPDLYVWLSDAAPGADSDAIKASRTIELEKLKGNVGAQNYILPEGVTPDDFASVTIWCRRFGVLFSQASFEPAGA